VFFFGGFYGLGWKSETFIDLNDCFRGPSFTWLRGGIHERLDRAIGNNVWLTAFPQSLVTYLPRIKSDHRPLLLILRLEANLPKDYDLLRQLEMELREDLENIFWSLDGHKDRSREGIRLGSWDFIDDSLHAAGTCSILVAELWAIFDGLTLILERGHDRVLINTDSMVTVLVIQDQYSRDSKSTLIRRIHQFLTKAHCNTPNPAQ
ncbi:hypothetical protein Gorai_003432, partial [Gossypium raimondii]|nr:hypothetical protein [Gossypium raimondii]